jgi:hypothetical protein
MSLDTIGGREQRLPKIKIIFAQMLPQRGDPAFVQTQLFCISTSIEYFFKLMLSPISVIFKVWKSGAEMASIAARA